MKTQEYDPPELIEHPGTLHAFPTGLRKQAWHGVVEAARQHEVLCDALRDGGIELNGYHRGRLEQESRDAHDALALLNDPIAVVEHLASTDRISVAEQKALEILLAEVQRKGNGAAGG